MYATRDDMVRQFGETECIALSDRDFTGEIDDDVLNGGLERATATIDSYLAGRYPVPWTDTPGILTGKWVILEKVQAGEALGPVMSQHTGIDEIGRKEGAIGVFTAGKLTRSSVYHQAVVLALSPFHNAIYRQL